MIPTLILVSIISFGVVQLIPGDYLTQRQMDPTISRETLEQQKENLGLDQPLPIRYWKWVKGVVTEGDFGYSFSNYRPVADVLFEGRIGFTIFLGLLNLVFVYLFSIPIGIYSAVNQYSIPDNFLTFFAFIGLSIPNFFLALVLLYFIAGPLDVGANLGVGGLLIEQYMGAPWFNGLVPNMGKISNFFWHVWPYMLAVGTASLAGVVRLMRGQMLEFMNRQFAQTAKAKGLRETVVIYKHVFRNAINPIITNFGYAFRRLVSGSLITAIVLGVPTVQRAYWTALNQQDEQVIMAGLVFFALMLLVGNLFADFLLAWNDPRIRYD
ncbi:ABC transporter permease [Candidatus Bipolaricaulota bacterium]|nr:ABC transporter permease [Candidatus Bipolaricaulota bacterium]